MANFGSGEEFSRKHTLLEFAAAALQGLSANPEFRGGRKHVDVAEWACCAAESLLEVAAERWELEFYDEEIRKGET
jgi:hypothetical protein